MKKLLTMVSLTAVLMGGTSWGTTANAQTLPLRNTATHFQAREHSAQGTRLGSASIKNLGRWRGLCSTWEYGERLTPSIWNDDPIRGQRMMGRLIRCVFDRFAPGQSSTALYVASRESGLYPWAQNVSSLCSGLFQHILSAWPSRAHSYLARSAWAPWVLWPDDNHETRMVFDPRANAIAAAKMVASGGWGPWGF